MTFKKNWLSYFLWVIYAFFACVGLIGVLSKGLISTPVNNQYARISIVCLSFVFLAGIYTLIRLMVTKIKKKSHYVLLEAFFAVFLLAIGIFLRVYFIYIYGGTQEAAYFEIGKVTGNEILPVAHGVQYYYVLLLRGLFLITGNFFMAGIILQICLQCLAALVWYFSIRNYTGSLAAIVFLSIIMFFPESTESAITYSPKCLYLLFFGIVLLLISKIYKSDQKFSKFTFIKTVLIGWLMGILAYLDISGLILWIPVLFICFFSQNKNMNETKRNTLFAFLQCITTMSSFIIFFFGCFLIDGYLNKVPMLHVLQVWRTIFRYKGVVSFSSIRTLFDAITGFELWMIVAITFLLVLGIPAFFIKKKADIQIFWFVLVVAVFTIWTLNIQYEVMTCEQLLLFVLSALTGAGIQAVFTKPEQVQKFLGEVDKVTEKEEVNNQPIIHNSSNDSAVKQINYIANPLPLPKKHVKRELNYQREVEMNQMKYDIEVFDQDDFDI